MKGYDITNDLKRLSDPSKNGGDVRHYRMPWTLINRQSSNGASNDSKYRINTKDITLKQVDEEKTGQHQESQFNDSKSLHDGGVSERHNYHIGSHTEPEPQHLVEYSESRKKYEEMLKKSKEKLNEKLKIERAKNEAKHIRDEKMKAIQGNIDQIRFGSLGRLVTAIRERSQEDEITRDEVSHIKLAKPYPNHFNNSSLNSERNHSAVKIPTQPAKQYKFNTKVLSDKLKMEEYKSRIKDEREYNWLKIGNKKIKKVEGRKDVSEVIDYAKKQEQKGGFNTDSKLMMVEKVKHIDRMEHLKQKKRKYETKEKQTGDKEDGYIDSIHLKMNLLKKLL